MLDAGTTTVIGGGATNAGSWTTAVGLPATSALLGLRVGLQAVIVGTPSSRGYDLTNGLALTLGR